MTERKLLIGVLIDAPQDPAPWMLRLLDGICASPQLELVALLEPADCVRIAQPAGLLRGWLSLEARLAARSRKPDCPVWQAVRSAVPVLGLDHPSRIEALGLDVVLDLSGSGQSCPAEVARHGVWFFDFIAAGPGVTAMRAILGPEPVTHIALCRRIAGRAEPVAVATGTLNTKFIAARNALFMCEKAVALLLRELRRAGRDGSPVEVQGARLALPARLGLVGFVRYLLRLSAEVLDRVSERLMQELRLRPGMFYLKTAGGDFLTLDPAAARGHPLPGNTYQADPFLWEHEGESYCFFETFDYSTGMGHISVGRFDNGRLIDIKTALRADYHLSFPFLFEHGGQLFMMPETCGAMRIETWRCIQFPDQWERHAVALEGTMAADSSLALIDGTWWLFTNISTDPFGDMNSELHLFRVKGPDLTSLVPHPLNPVVFDARTARNGGRILERDGVYYRPSQDNSHGTYGYGINLMRIDRLDEDDYAETLARRIEPDFEPGLIGCHHLDSRSGRIVFDVRKRIGGYG